MLNVLDGSATVERLSVQFYSLLADGIDPGFRDFSPAAFEDALRPLEGVEVRNKGGSWVITEAGRDAYYYAGRYRLCVQRDQARMKAGKAARYSRTPPERVHGTTGGYSNWGCRCDRCRVAWGITMRSRSTGKTRHITQDAPVIEEQAQQLLARWAAEGSLRAVA